PDSDTLYQGIGNAGPDYDPEYRPGDNKWAASVLALNPADGKIRWGFQDTPNDTYDFDEISEHPIITTNVNGEYRRLLVCVSRNGFDHALAGLPGSCVMANQSRDRVTRPTDSAPKTAKPLTCDPGKHVQA